MAGTVVFGDLNVRRVTAVPKVYSQPVHLERITSPWAISHMITGTHSVLFLLPCGKWGSWNWHECWYCGYCFALINCHLLLTQISYLLYASMNSETTNQKTGRDQGMWDGARNFHALCRGATVPATPPVHQPQALFFFFQSQFTFNSVLY